MGTDSTDKFLRKVIYYVDLIHCLSLYSLTNGYEVLTTQNNKHLLQFIFSCTSVDQLGQFNFRIQVHQLPGVALRQVFPSGHVTDVEVAT